jgi:hypothetical protein
MVPTAFGVTVAVPLAGLVPPQPSPGCPPLATQLAALDEVQVKVTGCPTATGDGAATKVTVGTTPVPLSATVWVPIPLPIVMLSVAVAGPCALGSNTTPMLQLAPTETELPQVLVCVKG